MGCSAGCFVRPEFKKKEKEPIISLPSSYGSVKSPQDPPEWTNNGTILQILITVAGSVGTHILFVISIFHCLSSAKGLVLRCRGKEMSSMSDASLSLCDYLSSYVECFPEFTTAIVLVLIGRNLLQLRFYYSMLERGAVVLFTTRHFFQDWIIRAYLWSYIHLVLHILFIAYAMLWGHAVEDIDHRLVGDRRIKQVQLVTTLCDLILVPCTLFVVYLFGAYDIEKCFLPLSQYFHDAMTIERKTGRQWEPEATCKLVVMTDVVAKMILDENYEELIEHSNDVDTLEDNLIKSYRAFGAQVEARQASQLGLVKSLWPSRLLASRVISGISQDGFAAIWFFVAFFGMCICTVLCLSMAYFCYQHSSWDDKFSRKVHSVVVLIHMIIVACFAAAFGHQVAMMVRSAYHHFYRPRLAF